MDVQIITKDPMRYKITYRSLVFAEKISLKDEEKQFGPSLSPPAEPEANNAAVMPGIGDETTCSRADVVCSS